MDLEAPAMAPFRSSGDGSLIPRLPTAASLLERDHSTETDVFTKISLGVGAFGIISSLFAFYWLVRMRRNFRQDLILLLIQSDFIKSLWFVIFPIVQYTQGPIPSDSAFCQAGGFFLAVGIESSDVAILLITLHSALYLLRPKSGMYPYRRFAYALYVVVPLVIASLAFIDGHGYANTGPYCYLESGPGWERFALSWVPRYVIFIIILITYIGIYAYVRSRMVDYGKGHHRKPGHDCQHGTAKGAPPIPTMKSHGLVPSAPSSVRLSGTEGLDRRPSVSSTNTAAEPGNNDVFDSKLDTPGPRTWTSKANSVDGMPSSSSTIIPPPSIQLSPRSPTTPGIPEFDTFDSSYTAVAEWPNSSTNTAPCVFSPTQSSAHWRRGSSSTQDILRPGGIQDGSEIARNRGKILHQLRSLFVYPLAYMLTWIFPFVRHARGYDSGQTVENPFWLMVVCIVCLTIQAVVDCAVFTIREEPWKHTQGGFWETLHRRIVEGWRKSWSKARVVGRTSEEMVVDGRNARARRVEEMAAERAVKGKHTTATTDRRRRDWWDVAFDGEDEDAEWERDSQSR